MSVLRYVSKKKQVIYTIIEVRISIPLNQPTSMHSRIGILNTSKEFTMSSQELRAVVRGTYDLQRLRIQMGNRVTANFKAKLGNSPRALTEKQLEKEAQKLLGDLRASHKRITDAIVEKYKGVTPKNFIGDELISTYTEYVLVNQYTELIKQEESQFSSIPTILAGNPVYDNFLEGVAGVGPQMAGVLLSEIDFTRCKYASSLWKLCFPKNTLISTMNGMIPINELVIGDKVIDASGNKVEVLETMSHKFTGEMVTINCIGTPSLTMTDEHPVLVVRDGATDWMPAKNILPGDMLVMPALRVNDNYTVEWNASSKAIGKSPRLGFPVTISDGFLYLCGRFIGDGHASTWKEGQYQRGVCSIAFGKHESDEISHCLNISKYEIGAGHVVEADRTNNLIFGRNTVATCFQEWFGHKAENKRIPEFIMGLYDPRSITMFLRGYFDSDGHLVPKGKSAGTIQANSVSKGLIYQLQLLLGKLGIYGTICETKRSNCTGEIDGKAFNQRPLRYQLSIPASDSGWLYSEASIYYKESKRKVHMTQSGDWLIPVKSIDKEAVEDIDVYNLHTSNSNTYLAQNLAVHNCGLDVVTIGRYQNEKGEEKILPARVIEMHYAENGNDVALLAEGKYPVTLEQVGRSRKDFCLELTEYTAKDGSTKVKQGISFNPFLKTKLIGVLASSFLRAGKTLVDGVNMSSVKRLELAKSLGYKPKTKSEEEDEIPSGSPVDDFLRANGHYVTFHPSHYGKMYYDNRTRLIFSPHHKEKTTLHIHNMALRFMIKRFLVDLYVHGRRSVDMPVHEEYGVAKLGMIPHGQDV